MEKISDNPAYRQLVRERNFVGWALTIVILIVYYGFIYLVAFQKEFMAKSVFDQGVTSLSVVLGLGVILITILLTGIYVWIANSRFDARIAKLKKGI